MPNETHGNDSVASAAVADDRDAAGREVRRFILDAIDAAGGVKAVADALSYTEGAVRSWRATKTPPPDVLFALARLSRLSLDRYALAPTIRDELDDLKERVAALEAGAA